MIVYDIYENHPARDGTPQIVLVADHFSWFAFLLPAIWALTYRLWWHALGYILVSVAGAVLLHSLFTGESLIWVWLVALHWVFGMNAAAWRGQRLEADHYQFVEVRSGATLASVETELITEEWLTAYNNRWRNKAAQQAAWRGKGLTQPLATMFETER